MTQRSLLETKEYLWLVGTLLVCTSIALGLIWTIPIVNELPEGASTATDYVVDATVARFGAPVVVLLLLASVITALGHNKGDGRPGLDFAAKVCNFGAATFSMWAVISALCAGAALPA